jgi:hypothetical protein
MCNHPANSFVLTACTLAIALFTIGQSVNPSWAGSGRPTRIAQEEISPNYASCMRTYCNPEFSNCMTKCPYISDRCLSNLKLCNWSCKGYGFPAGERGLPC